MTAPVAIGPGRVRRWSIALLAILLVAAAGGLVLRPATAATDTSATTKKGASSGPFKDLEITVSKTANLVNEVVEVSWKGGVRTEPEGGFKRNFLQLMQCWGDDPKGPKPEQCQFGAIGSVQPDPTIGGAVRTRQLSSTQLPVDPAQTGADRFLPFDPVSDPEVPGTFDGFNAQFDAAGTNEIPVAATREDGTGQEFFEVQTAAEAHGLGCGQAVGGKPRACWLVAVPRSDREVDGSIRKDDSGTDVEAQRLETSPLSASNWKHAIAFPLQFQPITGACKLGVAQIPVLGQESATEAIAGWQQSLCTSTGEVFEFNQVPDDLARGKLSGATPALSIVTKPLAGKPSSGSAVYAPITVSGLGFAYNVETQTVPSDPADVRARSGLRVTDLKLTPRLVAKLLSQSYRNATNDAKPIEGNPARLEDDPEFRDVNPAFKSVNRFGNSVFTVITPLNPADVNGLVWAWISGDQKAREFLAGQADEHGMKVNPNYKAMDLDRLDFPKLDQVCRPANADGGPLCIPDALPYSGDMHEAVRAAARGDTLAKTSWSALSNPPVYKKADRPQPKGSRSIMVVSDSATAARMNLPMAQLRNADGKFVAPDPKNLLAAVKAMKPSGNPGVLAPNPNAPGADVYPLTSIGYAAAVPAALSAKDRAAYAGLLKHATGPGQKVGTAPGSLPAGYAPLPADLVRQGAAAADALASFRPATTPTPTSKPTTKPGASGGGSGGSGSGSGSSTGAGSGSGSSAGAGSGSGSSTGSDSGSGSSAGSGSGTGSGSGSDPGVGGTTTTPPEGTPIQDPTTTSPGPVPDTGVVGTPIIPPGGTQTVAGVTPAVPVGKARLVLLWVFVFGVLVAGAGQLLPRARAWSAGPTVGVMPAPEHPALPRSDQA